MGFTERRVQPHLRHPTSVAIEATEEGGSCPKSEVDLYEIRTKQQRNVSRDVDVGVGVGVGCSLWQVSAFKRQYTVD
jgi:hypothetical protein